MQQFYWVFDGVLAGSSCPGLARTDTPAPGSVEDKHLDRDLEWLRRQGIGAILSLTESPLDARATKRVGLDSLHVPVPDLTAPRPEQLLQALDFIDWQRSGGRAVVVHCKVGQGRTATVLAAYLIRSGSTVDHAIARMRALCPGAIGSADQELALQAFAAQRSWIV